MDNYEEITEEEYKDFKKLYEESVKSNAEQFTFKGRPVLTAFAKYVIEYLDGKMKAV